MRGILAAVSSRFPPYDPELGRKVKITGWVIAGLGVILQTINDIQGWDVGWVLYVPIFLGLLILAVGYFMMQPPPPPPPTVATRFSVP